MRKKIVSILLAVVSLLSVFSVSAAAATIERGIDVSQWQGVIDWEKVKPQIDFAIIRCAQGSDLQDTQWEANASACTELGIPFGVYLRSYALSDEDALKEAEFALKLLEKYNPSLPVYLDLEAEDGSDFERQSAADKLRHTKIFCEAIEAAGYRAGVYSNYYWWTTKLSDPGYDQWDRWLARWNCDSPGYSKPYSTWQYSSTGRIDGINGNVDLNYRCVDPSNEDEQINWPDLLHNCPGAAFTDMPKYGNWAHAGIDYCVSNNLIYGTSDTTFSPDAALTRGQFVAILWRHLDCPAPQGENPFTDLTMNYYRDAIAWAAENKIVYGIDATHFNPDSAITRQELTTMFYRYVGEYLKRDVSGNASITDFPDHSKVSNYAREAMTWGVSVRLISGNMIDGTVYLDPLGSATRAQAATMFMNLFETVLK